MCFLDQRHSVFPKQKVFRKKEFINNSESLIHNETEGKDMNELYLRYFRTPLIRINWDKPSGCAENLDNWIFH